jgi:hypothetical protein
MDKNETTSTMSRFPNDNLILMQNYLIISFNKKLIESAKKIKIFIKGMSHKNRENSFYKKILNL